MVGKILQLTELFSQQQINGYLIPTNDEFFNEYVPPHYRRLEHITGFSGSFGIALITKHGSALFTDGRYLLQAKLELPADIIVLEYNKQSIIDFVATLPHPLHIGYDPKLFTEITLKLFSSHVECTAITPNLVDNLWQDRPSLPRQNISVLPEQLSGMSRGDKLKLIADKIPNSADYLLITALDSICWLLNIRAEDIPYTPFVLAQALLDREGNCKLFLRNKVKLMDVAVHHIDDFYNHITNKKIALTAANIAIAILEKVPSSHRIEFECPITLVKASKNSVELAGMKDCHRQDGVALCKFMHFVDTCTNLAQLSEYDLAEKLLEFRTQQEHFLYPSFASISAFAENGAIIHYHPSSHNSKKFDKAGLYLIDSGGQYINGTTDVTRVMPIGEIKAEYKKHYTLVLKGHIALATLKFPVNTTGHQIDAIARQYLWQHGLDYKHGTGHGVGHFLSVHEGPQRISPVINKVALREGMVLSNEPGVYFDNQYGIRLENLMYIAASEYHNFLQFNALTLAPFDNRLIDMEMLNANEKQWLKAYHEQVYKSLHDYLEDGERQWLKKINIAT